MLDIKKVAVGVILLVIFILLIFTLVGNSANDLRTAADSITDANNCTDDDSQRQYNYTNKYCYNSTGDGGGEIGIAKQIDLPLGTLFGRNSVLLLIFMTVILMIAIITIMKGLKAEK